MKPVESAARTRCRGRPATFSREKLVETVMDLFWQHGYQNLSFNKISSATGLPRASLYNAFKSKEALFLECIRHYNATSPLARLDGCEPGEKVGPLLHTVFDRICELRANDKSNRGCLAANTFSELAASGTPVGAALLAAQAKNLSRMTKLVLQAVAQNELPEDTDAEATAQILMAFLSGLSARSKTGASKEELARMSNIFLKRMGFDRWSLSTFIGQAGRASI